MMNAARRASMRDEYDDVDATDAAVAARRLHIGIQVRAVRAGLFCRAFFRATALAASGFKRTRL